MILNIDFLITYIFFYGSFKHKRWEHIRLHSKIGIENPPRVKIGVKKCSVAPMVTHRELKTSPFWFISELIGVDVVYREERAG